MDAFVKQVQKGDTEGLLDARQSFDQLPAIKKLLKTEGLGENARREIVLEVRGSANRYIASLLPEGNTYRADLLQEHRMLEALGNISDKSASIIGKNRLQLMTNEYPILKWIIGGLAGGAVFAGGVGAGGALIVSTD